MSDENLIVPETNEPPPADSLRHEPSPRYERSDVPFGGVWPVALAGVACAVVGLYAVWTLFRIDLRYFDSRAESRYPLAAENQSLLPAEPRLEQIDRLAGSHVTDVDQLQFVWHRHLESYGRTDSESYVHIPIQQAIALIVADLPVRPQRPDTGRDRGLIDSGEPNSGRMLRGASP